MADIFDQVAGQSAAPSGDIFDQVAAKGSKDESSPVSARLPTPSDAVAVASENARQLATAMNPPPVAPPLPAALRGIPLTGTSIGPARPQTLTEKLQEAVMGGPHTGDTPVGRNVFHRSFEAPSEPHVPTTDLPMLRLGQFGPEAAEVLGNAAMPGVGPLIARTPVGQGIGKGMADLAEGMTTAPNALMLAGSGGLGMLGKVSPLLPRAISAYFSQDMLRSAYAQIPEVRRALNSGDAEAAAAAITKAVGTGVLGAAAGVHAVRGEGVGGEGARSQEPGARTEEPHSPDIFDEAAKLPEARQGDIFDQAAKLPQRAGSPEPQLSENSGQLQAEGNTAQKLQPNAASSEAGKPLDAFDQHMAEEEAKASAPKPGQVVDVPTEEIRADPARLQFKSEDKGGSAPAEGEKFDAAKSGPVTLWKDPTDQQTYVVDGHHRMDLAQEAEEPTVKARYIEAADADEARAKGALINMADGKGDVVDAAKALRGMDVDEKSLAKDGIPVDSEQVKQAVALSKLPEETFAKLTSEGVGDRQAPGASEGVKPPPFPSEPPPLPTDTSAIAAEEEGKRTPAAAADTGTTLGAGLGAFEPFFKESIEEGNALRAKRKAAMDALDARAGTPEQAKAGEALRQWFTGERDTWSTRVNQAIDRASRLFTPDVRTREAVGIMREFEHRKGELREFLDGSHPALQGADADALKRIDQLRPAMQMALHPTPKMEKANRVYTNIAEKSLQEGKAGGWLGSRWKSDEYMPHLLSKEGEGAVPAPPADRINLQGNIGKHFQFASKRFDEYPTMLHAIADGKLPKTMDPADAFAIHGTNFARARATHLFEEQMAKNKMGHWGTEEDAPKGWEPLAQHSDEFSRYKEGGMQRLYVPPFIQEALKPITDPEFSGRAFTAVRGAQRTLKEAILGLSGFHLLTENVMAVHDIGPSGMYQAFKASRDSADFLKWERDAAAHGELTSIAGRTMDAYKNLKPGSIPTRGEILRAYVPGSKQALELADHITKFTFDNIQRRFKVVSYMLHSMAWDNQNPHGTPAQRSLARQGIASYVNGVYGGLHWENMGRSKAFVETARAILLAPDWTGSNVALGKYAVNAKPSMQEAPFRNKLEGAADKESVQARLSRAFWAKNIVGGLVATQAMSLMLSGQLSKRPFAVYMGKDGEGKDTYTNMMFRGAPGDLVHVAQLMEEHGLLQGTGTFLGGKAAPFTKAAIHLVTGRNDFGKEIAPKGLSPVANTVRTAGQAVSDLSPIPITAKSIYHTMSGDEASKYTWTERAMSLIGPPPQHVAPEKESTKPENSVWDQIRTGQAHESGHRKKGQ